MEKVMFKAGRHFGVKKCTVLRETEHFVYIPCPWGTSKPRREAKEGLDTVYFDTLEAAVEHYTTHLTRQLDSARHDVAWCEKELDRYARVNTVEDLEQLWKQKV